MIKLAQPINDSKIKISSHFSPNHKGLDYPYPAGTPVFASEEGEVTIARSKETRTWLANTNTDPYKISKERKLKTEDYGNLVKLTHAGGYTTIYAHLSVNSLTIEVGDKVKKGQMIATVGSTGNSSGNHLHWEPRQNNIAINPRYFLDKEFTNYFQESPNMRKDCIINSDEEGKALFEKLVNNSRKWDEVVKYLEVGTDPKDTPFDSIKSVVAGFKSRNTDLQNQVNESTTELLNRREQVVRLKAELLESHRLRKDLNIKLNDTIGQYAEVQKTYEKEIKRLQSQIDKVSGEKGSLNKEIKTLQAELDNGKVKYTELLKNSTDSVPLKNRIWLVLQYFLRK